MTMSAEYVRFLEQQIAEMRKELYKDDVRPEYKQRNKDLINYYLVKMQTVDNKKLNKN